MSTSVDKASDTLVAPSFKWKFELTLHYRAHDYQIKFSPSEPFPDCPLFEPTQQEEDTQENISQLGAWFIQREAHFPPLEVFENGTTDKEDKYPLRGLPKEGQIEIKITCEDPEGVELKIFTLPSSPFKLDQSILKRPYKPKQILRQKDRNTKNLDGFYHADKDSSKTDYVVLFIKHGAIKGVRFFIPDELLPRAFLQYWKAKHPIRTQRKIRFAATPQTLVFDGEDSPSQVRLDLRRQEKKKTKEKEKEKPKKKRGPKKKNGEDKSVDTETVPSVIDVESNSQRSTPVGTPLKSVLRSPSSDFRIIPFDPKNKVYEQIIQKNTQLNSTITPSVNIGGEAMTLEQLSVVQIKDELKKRGEQISGVRSNLAHRLKLCLISEARDPAAEAEIPSWDPVPKDLMLDKNTGYSISTTGGDSSSTTDNDNEADPKKKKKKKTKKRGKKKRSKGDKEDEEDVKSHKHNNNGDQMLLDDTDSPPKAGAPTDDTSKKRGNPRGGGGGRWKKKRKLTDQKEERLNASKEEDTTTTEPIDHPVKEKDMLGKESGSHEELEDSHEDDAPPPKSKPTPMNTETAIQPLNQPIIALIQSLQASVQELTQKNMEVEKRNEVLALAYNDLKAQTESLKAERELEKEQNQLREKQNTRIELQLGHLASLLVEMNQRLDAFQSSQCDTIMIDDDITDTPL